MRDSHCGQRQPGEGHRGIVDAICGKTEPQTSGLVQGLSLSSGQLEDGATGGSHNLGNLWRRLVLPNRIGNWSLPSLQQRLVKTGGRVVKHARYYWLLLAESHLTRRLFGAMVGRIAALPVAAG
jgi:hypothetical protein